MKYYTVTYTDNRTKLRMTRYFKERHLLDKFVGNNFIFFEGAEYGTKEM